MTGARIGIIGYGAIGRDLHTRLRHEGHRVTVLLRPESARRGDIPDDTTVVGSLKALIDTRPDLAIEAAGQDALEAYGPALLEAGIPLVPASTGALGDPEVFARLEQAARIGGSRIVVPGGALGGLDYLSALRGTPDAAVRYTSRKPPAAWAAELAAVGHDAASLSGEVVLFEGEPAEAARRYPRNVNAGLTVALAAAPAPVTVRVVADPTVTLNTHEIAVESALGTAFLRFANRPAPANPKTSALTAASLAAAVRRLLDPVML